MGRNTMAIVFFGYICHVFNFQQYIRQQTTTVDYKRLINGLVLTRFASLQGKNN